MDGAAAFASPPSVYLCTKIAGHPLATRMLQSRPVVYYQDVPPTTLPRQPSLDPQPPGLKLSKRLPELLARSISLYTTSLLKLNEKLRLPMVQRHRLVFTRLDLILAHSRHASTQRASSRCNQWRGRYQRLRRRPRSRHNICRGTPALARFQFPPTLRLGSSPPWRVFRV